MEMGPPKEPSGFPEDIVPLSHHAAAIQEEGGTWYCDEARRGDRDGCPYRVKEETVRIHHRIWGSQEGHIEAEASQEGHIEVEAIQHWNSTEMDDMEETEGSMFAEASQGREVRHPKHWGQRIHLGRPSPSSVPRTEKKQRLPFCALKDVRQKAFYWCSGE
jgi:hypothetical protein